MASPCWAISRVVAAAGSLVVAAAGSLVVAAAESLVVAAAGSPPTPPTGAVGRPWAPAGIGSETRAVLIRASANNLGAKRCIRRPYLAPGPPFLVTINPVAR